MYTVRGVGSGSRDVDAWSTNGLYTEDRGLQVPITLKHDPVTSSGKSASGPDPRIRHRIQINMFRPIRVDHTNCLHVTIITHSFLTSLRFPSRRREGVRTFEYVSCEWCVFFGQTKVCAKRMFVSCILQKNIMYVRPKLNKK